MKQAFIILMQVVVMAGQANAAPAVQHLTLKEAIGAALENNHLIRAAGHHADAARQGVAIAESYYYPSLTFEEALTASNAPTQAFMMKLDEARFTQNDFLTNNLNHPSASHDFRTALTVNQPLYRPSIAPARELAARESEKQDLGLEAARQDIAFQVFRRYLEVQKAVAQLKAADQAIGDARENLRLAGVRRDAGVGLLSDELRARTHLSAVEQRLISVRNDLELAKLHLADVVGLKNGQELDIAESAPAFAPPLASEDLVAVARENRKELQQYRAELGKSEAALKLARSAYLPEVGAFASYQMNARDVPLGADNDAWVAGVSLTWQLFDGFRRYRDRDRAVAERSATAEQLEQANRDIALQVRENRLRREEMGKRLEVARNALRDAEETVRLLTRRFENSLATMVDLLDAQNALNQVRSNLAESEANYALAGGRVYHAAGTFLKEIMK
ncbi:TolC family protein [Oryzomonas sagensis]|uniref:TolC family protein n=1 Tax=Oryzomonas sagensis TaxID=2603857 RepID=A0ABQ6TRY4_9BACT|nr:TolC family protein [Oryzomonas sagensis]KAB0671796.1 TolC family protein [Oryzomonas sagensis]